MASHYLTAEQSADLKMALKHDPVTDELREKAACFPIEADEAVSEVLAGHDTCLAASWVSDQIGDDWP